MARIYTRQGDGGTTRLLGGERVSKADERVEACGTIDELNSQIGLVRTTVADPWIDGILEKVQNLLIELGSELASPEAGESAIIVDEDVVEIEDAIDKASAACPPLCAFILPGGSASAAHLHVARAVCRRTERRLAALSVSSTVRPTAQAFVNRLSDLLFALARLANVRSGVPDSPCSARPKPQK
jgi:cob(I)alamin adenosyltransferase